MKNIKMRKCGLIEYSLSIKPVKNINLRVRADGKVFVSANRYVPMHIIDEFVLSKEKFIEKAKSRANIHINEKTAIDNEKCQAVFKECLINMCKKIGREEPPALKIKNLKSMWGNCYYKKDTITLNSRLINAPYDCLEYVILHELCHFACPDHSPRFWKRVEEYMPDYKGKRKKLREASRAI